jgi:hypothetical protein
MKHHRRARSRGDHDGAFAGEGADRVANDFPRGRPVAPVESGLTATGLTRWKIHGAPQMLEHFDRCASHVIVECIADAGGHQLHATIGGGQAAVREIHGKGGKEAFEAVACNP